MNKLYLALAVTAGFAGGVLSRYIAPERVFAQAPAPTKAGEPLRAAGFVLLDKQNRTAGVFAIDKFDSKPNIVLYDDQGNVIWAARPYTVLKPLSEK